MQAAASLKVSKYTLEVEVRNVRGDESRVQVYLAEGVRKDGRAESIHDVLETRRFIPVRGKSGGTEMVAVSHLSWVRMALIEAIDELDLAAEDDGGVLAQVKVELEDGSWLEGAFRYAMPEGRRRLIDYLAVLPRWVPLRKGEFLYLIGRDRIMRVVPVEVS